MLFLWIFGDNVEDAMGHARYAIFYLLVGALAACAHMFVSPDDLTPAIGASGAIAGVMGAYIVLFPRATVAVIIPIFFFIPFPLPAFVLIGFWFVAQIFSGFASLGPNAVGAGGGVAYFAHIGGFIAGALLINFFALGRPRRQPRRPMGMR
jgi:membrane associated rhomboid family serine protease